MSFVDPLWEFVLEDYEDEDIGRRRILGGSRKKRGSWSGRDESSWNFDWFDGRDDNNSSSRKQTSGYDFLRSRSNESNGSRSLRDSLRGSKRSGRGRRSKYKDDQEDSFWDIISGAPPSATIPKKISSKKRTHRKNSNPPTVSPKQNTSELNKSPPLRRSSSKSSIASSTKSGASETKTKKKNIKQRFKWKESSKSAEKSNMDEYGSGELGVKHTTLNESSELRMKPPMDDHEFDPVEVFFQLADKLDPWADDTMDVSSFENDSDDESSSSGDEVDDETSHSTKRQNGNARKFRSSSKGERSFIKKSTSLRKKTSPKVTNGENKGKTEIRLRVNPVGKPLSEEIFETSHKNLNHGQFLVSEEDGISKSTPSFEDSENSAEFLDLRGPREVHPVQLNQNEPVPSEDQKGSQTNKTRKDTRTTNGYPESKCSKVTNRNVLKKTVCNLRKIGKNDSSSRSNFTETLPTSREIVDGQTHSIISSESELMNELAAANSKRLAQSNALQPVFAYDYDSNENMDVSYSTPNQSPRSSISVRSLGIPPPLSTSSSVGDKIVIQVEASTISETDCIIRQGLWWRDRRPTLPNTPGIDVVGKVYNINKATSKAYKLKPMQTVLSLVKWGGNARFMTINPKELVKVPDGLDPAEVACLAESYLSAFQVLHKGQTGKLRYRTNALKGKSLLILGAMTNNMGKAMIELALHAGVANIYATAKKKHWKRIISYGVIPLSTDPMQWIHRISGTIDLVLAPNGSLREDVTPVHFRALRPKFGQLIICGNRVVGNDIPINDWKRNHQAPVLACGKNKALQQILSNSLSYDVYDEWEKNLDLCKRDLEHLLQTLESKAIKPEVLDRLPLDKVARAQELLEMKRLPGYLVCEPWLKGKKRAIYL